MNNITNEENNTNPLKKMKMNRIFIPVLIGFLVVGWMLYKELNVSKIQMLPVNFEITKKWHKLKSNNTSDTIYCIITDSTIASKTNIQFSISYLTGEGKNITECVDTLIIYNTSDSIYSNNNIFLKHVKKIKPDTIEFVFSKPVKRAYNLISFSYSFFFLLILGFLLIFVRDIGFTTRLLLVTRNQIGILQAWKIIMLWEFSAAIAPSAIGGGGIAVFFLNKEGISVGKSTSNVLTILFLDQLFFALIIPVLLFFIGFHHLFFFIGDNEFDLSNRFVYFAVISYGIVLAYTLFLAYGLFINPRGIKMFLLKIVSFKILRRWRHSANKLGTDMIESSVQLKKQPFTFWLKSFGATSLAWSARYWIVNVLLLAFVHIDNHFLLYGRQAFMWIMMLVSPTPGGSGFSEYVFKEFLGDFIPTAGLAVILALIWRLITYYPYLILGAIILPRWIKQKYGK